jgi:hypothetical protein
MSLGLVNSVVNLKSVKAKLFALSQLGISVLGESIPDPCTIDTGIKSFLILTLSVSYRYSLLSGQNFDLSAIMSIINSQRRELFTAVRWTHIS